MISPGSDTIIDEFQMLQDRICQGLEALDSSAKFEQDSWDRPEGGGGRTRIIQGQHIQKGGVNFSAVHGSMPESIQKALQLAPNDFLATGVSIVLHAHNPWVPIIHMNVRYFETNTGQWWFGGGIDVTPHYIIRNESRVFHETLRDVCDDFDGEAYQKYKKWADDYFYNQHRNETRGIGGIFFDQLNESSGHSKQDIWSFVKAIGDTFLKCYEPLFKNNFEKDFFDEDILWQSVRRGRYVEFNLVYDRGTKFGLQTNGRIESILMSLPPIAQWHYNLSPPNLRAKETSQLLIKGVDWLNDKAD